MKKLFLNLSASNTKGILVLQALSTLLFFYCLLQNYRAEYWLLSFFVYFCTGCLGITVTFHRYLSHRSFHLPRYLEYVFSFFGALGGTGSPLGWVFLHREHHAHSDTEKDPHSPANGAWKVFFSQYQIQFNKWKVRNLIADPFHQYLHLYYHLVLLAWATFWFLVSRDLFLFVVAVPMAIQIWISTASNIFNHRLGYRNFDSQEHSTNNFLIAFISWGEGWHNNHHQFPSRWNFKVKWWEFDMSSYVISAIKVLHR